MAVKHSGSGVTGSRAGSGDFGLLHMIVSRLAPPNVTAASSFAPNPVVIHGAHPGLADAGVVLGEHDGAPLSNHLAPSLSRRLSILFTPETKGLRAGDDAAKAPKTACSADAVDGMTEQRKEKPGYKHI
jgi:hypothetical protein